MLRLQDCNDQRAQTACFTPRSRVVTHAGLHELLTATRNQSYMGVRKMRQSFTQMCHAWVMFVVMGTLLGITEPAAAVEVTFPDVNLEVKARGALTHLCTILTVP